MVLFQALPRVFRRESTSAVLNFRGFTNGNFRFRHHHYPRTLGYVYPYAPYYYGAYAPYALDYDYDDHPGYTRLCCRHFQHESWIHISTAVFAFAQLLSP